MNGPFGRIMAAGDVPQHSTLPSSARRPQTSVPPWLTSLNEPLGGVPAFGSPQQPTLPEVPVRSVHSSHEVTRIIRERRYDPVFVKVRQAASNIPSL
jgi:hypothetical protein